MFLQEEQELIVKLTKLRFIGQFPGGIDVLLVPLSTAVDEAKLDYPDMTENVLKRMLKQHDVHIFNNKEDWAKYKGIASKYLLDKGLDVKKKYRR